MPARLGADARKVLLTSAMEEAHRRGDRRLGTDHLLLALLHDPESPAARALDVDLDKAREASAALDRTALTAVGIDVGDLTIPAWIVQARRRLPLTSGARAVFLRGILEARSARAGRVEPRHLLLALLTRERPDPAAELLAALGVDPAEARKRLGPPAR